jgi:thioredoxin-like negative regulator of GroEL
VSRILQGAARDEVERLCREGDQHAAAGEHAEALECFMEAWALLPEPREEYLDTARIFHGFTRVLRAGGALGGGLDLLMSGRSHFAPVLAAMGWRAGED